MYLVVAKTKIKFWKVLSTNQFIQKVINDRNGFFFFDCDFVEGSKIQIHVASAFILEYHDYQRRIGVGTRMDNTNL
jgi:hypothetical protein